MATLNAALEGEAEGKARDPWLDNAKFVFVLLIVFNHLIFPFLNEYGAGFRAAYTVFRLTNMPALAFILGLHINRSKLDLRPIISAALLFQLLHYLPAILRGEPLWWASIFFYPHLQLWFLWSLVCWRLLLPVLEPVRGVVLVAVVLGLIRPSLEMDGRFLAIGSTLTYLPFYLAGHLHGRSIVERLRSPALALRISFYVLGLPLLAGLGLIFSNVPSSWFNGLWSYQAMGLDLWEGVRTRAGLYAASCVCVLVFLACVPRRRLSFVSLRGQRTFNVFISHYLLIYLFMPPLHLMHDRVGSIAFMGLSVVLTMLIVAVLGSAPANYLIKGAIRVVQRLVFGRDAAEVRPSAEAARRSSSGTRAGWKPPPA